MSALAMSLIPFGAKTRISAVANSTPPPRPGGTAVRQEVLRLIESLVKLEDGAALGGGHGFVASSAAVIRFVDLHEEACDAFPYNENKACLTDIP